MLKLKDLVEVINFAAIEYCDDAGYVDYDGQIKLLADLPEQLLNREVESIDDSGLDETYLIIRLR